MTNSRQYNGILAWFVWQGTLIMTNSRQHNGILAWFVWQGTLIIKHHNPAYEECDLQFRLRSSRCSKSMRLFHATTPIDMLLVWIGAGVLSFK